MRWFDNLSIRYKLTCLFTVMACAGAVTTSLLMGVFDMVRLRQTMVQDLATLADVLARNSTAALSFHDAESATDALQALRAEPSVVSAAIYDANGHLFATYRPTRDSTDFTRPGPASTRFQRDRLIEFRDVVLNHERIGTIYIESDLRELESRRREYLIAFVITLTLTLAIALSLASRLQRPISIPLGELVRVASAISVAGDYSIRAKLSNQDEFGVLVSAFNGMLGQIENRDWELRQHRERLEEEVASRTVQLVSANTRLQHAEEKYRTIFEDAVIGIFQISPEGRPLSVNRAVAQMHGFDSPEQLLAEVSDVATQLFVDPQQMLHLVAQIEQDSVVRGVEIQVYRRNRTKKWVRANFRAVRNHDGKMLFIEGTSEDVTDRKVAEQRVQFLAYYDALTGLANRTLLQDRLEKAIASSRRRDDKVAVMFLDLDRFKIINDSLGHSFGDLLLQEVAERLKACARAQDTVARIGGDEFVIMLTTVKDASDIAVIAERVRSLIAPGFHIQGRSLSVSCSIGISLFPDHGADGETLIKNADAAMYAAKESGRDAFRFFTADMNAEVVERLNLEHSLRTALERKELFLLYQPQADIQTGEIVGVEALLRWKHPEQGIVSPDRFIRIAENTGLIMPIGEWVLRTACSDGYRWNSLGLPPITIAVNVSAIQFRQSGFHQLVRKVLQETSLDPRCLELELTESLLLSNADVTLSVLEEFSGMGVKLAIDDFGTGYSSLSYLRQFPVNKLKIDRSFIRHVASSADDAAITSAIISMAKNLNLRVIAEGVEDAQQFAFLQAQHCDELQGFYLEKPLTAQQVTDMLLLNESVVRNGSLLGDSGLLVRSES